MSSFTQSPIRGVDDSFVTRRNRHRVNDDDDDDLWNESFMSDDSQYIDLDTPPRRRRSVNVSMTEEEINEENRRQLARLQENAYFNIDDFDTEDKHVVLPTLSAKIEYNEPVYDFINIREIPLKQFLEEDEDNIVFKFATQKLWMGIDRNLLAESVKNPSQIKYACLNAKKMADDVAEVLDDPAYYYLRGIGFPSGVLTIHDIGAIMRDKINRMYALVPTNEVLKSTITYGYVHYYLPATDLCNEGHEEVVYKAHKIRVSGGGKKKAQNAKKTKKEQKTKKTRKQRKNKKKKTKSKLD